MGIFLLCLTAGLLALAVNTFYQAAAERASREGRARAPEERVFAVNVDTLTLGRATPIITAFGEVASRRTLDVRTSTGGRVIDVAEAFRDGGRVERGAVLIRIDPADAQAAVDIAAAELAEAEATASEAATSAELAQVDLAAARQTRDLRARALDRQRGLEQRGAGTGASVEAAEIALASADQAVVGRRQALAQAESQRDLSAIAVERRQIALREARRALEDTTVTAPYDGLLTAAASVPGAIVGSNEKIGSLIDTSQLEVAFRVSNAQYARLLDDSGRLTEAIIEATLPLDDFPIRISGHLDRAGAQVEAGQTGRLLYARLDGAGAEALRPGDFMIVEIAEPALENVAVVPATAVSTQGEIFLLGEGDRLEAQSVTILRRQGNEMILADVPEGRIYARDTPPQLGSGVKIRPIHTGSQVQVPDTVALTEDLRAQLMAAVAANSALPQPARTRMMERLAGQQVPREMVDRLLGTGAEGEADSNTAIVLEPERKARLIAFVEGNQRMPGEVKTRILSQLNAEQVPASVVERLESRMGG